MSGTEKITINMGAVDLGKIDLLVGEGLYSNRTDFIRAAIRAQAERHGLEIQQTLARYAYVVGVLRYDRGSLERLKQQGKRVSPVVLGSLVIDRDVPAELAAQVFERVQVRGQFNATDAVKAALADRTG
jgi:Arc/MetJ-type ribon-helix-helix transcriptional regulator